MALIKAVIPFATDTTNILGAKVFLDTLEEIPMPGQLFEGNPEDEGTTGRSTDPPVISEIPAGSTHIKKSGVILEQLEM